MRAATADAHNGISTPATVTRQRRMRRRSWTHASMTRKSPETRTYRRITPPFSVQLQSLCPSNALVQLQARYYHCGGAASEKCLSAATFVRQGVTGSLTASRRASTCGNDAFYHYRGSSLGSWRPRLARAPPIKPVAAPMIDATRILKGAPVRPT